MRGTLLVGLVLSFVTMLSVLSVPLMINPNSPTMMTVDVAYRISTHGDYAVANALCLVSLPVLIAERVARATDRPVEVHCHNDYGLATACDHALNPRDYEPRKQDTDNKRLEIESKRHSNFS